MRTKVHWKIHPRINHKESKMLNINDLKETTQWIGGAIIIVTALWKSASYIYHQIQPINSTKIKKILSNVQDQTNSLLLPPLPGPQYKPFPISKDSIPPRPITQIKAVEVNIPHPLFHQVGKPTPTVKLELANKEFIAIFTSKRKRKKTDYFENHKSYTRQDFALWLDLSKFRKNPNLLPSESSHTRLQDLIDHCEWLNAGTISKFEWRPYGMVLYTSCQKGPQCHGPMCMTAIGGKTFDQTKVKDTDHLPKSGKMFYGSPPATFEEVANHLGMGHDETRAHIQKEISNIYSECEGLSAITRDQNGMTTNVEDRNPDTTERETGWVLHRDKIELHDYRIRQIDENSYQAIIYPCPLNREVLTQDFEEFRTSEPQFPTRNQWTEAVKDLFKKLAPQAEPIYGTPEDPWLPTNLK